MLRFIDADGLQGSLAKYSVGTAQVLPPFIKLMAALQACGL